MNQANPILNSVNFLQTGLRKYDAAAPRTIALKDEISEVRIPGQYAYQYKMAASFFAEGFANSSSEIAKLKRDCANLICRGVYGPYISLLNEVRFAIHDRDLQKALQLIDQIQDDMVGNNAEPTPD